MMIKARDRRAIILNVYSYRDRKILWDGRVRVFESSQKFKGDDDK